MHDLGTLRTLALFAPILLASVLWAERNPGRRHQVGLGLALAWNLGTLLALNVVAARVGWWTFGTRGGELAGIPLDVLLGWAVLWALVAPLLLGRSIVAQITLAGCLDVVLMPRLEPLVSLGPHWLAGEAIALGTALVPGALLARWTSEDTHLGGRATLQGVLVAILGVLVLPLVAATREPLHPDLRGALGLVSMQALVLALVLGVASLRELVERGGGTPFPLDPTRRLVTSGPYAYVANPMQCSGALGLLGLAGVFHSVSLVGAALVATAYSAGFAAWQEDGELRRRFGAGWDAYRVEVPRWLPRRRPLPGPPARLYVAAGCDACSQVGRWVAAREPVGLELVAAELAPEPLRRMTYVAPDGRTVDGVAALGRALEHASLGWALLGFWVRLPLVRPAVQLVVDACGGGPRDLAPACAAVTLQPWPPPVRPARTSGVSPRSRRRRRGTASATSSSATDSATSSRAGSG